MRTAAAAAATAAAAARRERKQLTRTTADMFRLVPMVIILVRQRCSTPQAIELISAAELVVHRGVDVTSALT
jgi:hypothetical protein